MKKISMLLVFVMAVSLLLPCILNTDAYALDKIYCPQCGNQISADSRFCMFCGAEIPAIGSSSAAAETPAGTWAGLTGIEIGDRVFFGEYEQDNNYYNGKEKIEWIVIGRDGNNLKLLSRYALDRQPFNTDWVDITWERCTLREWLNETFLNTAFSYGEQRSILRPQ